MHMYVRKLCTHTHTYLYDLLGFRHLFLGELDLEMHSGVCMIFPVTLDEGLLLASLSVNCASKRAISMYMYTCTCQGTYTSPVSVSAPSPFELVHTSCILFSVHTNAHVEAYTHTSIRTRQAVPRETWHSRTRSTSRNSWYSYDVKCMHTYTHTHTYLHSRTRSASLGTLDTRMTFCVCRHSMYIHISTHAVLALAHDLFVYTRMHTLCTNTYTHIVNIRVSALTQCLEELLVLLRPLVHRELSDVDDGLVSLLQDTTDLIRYLKTSTQKNPCKCTCSQVYYICMCLYIYIHIYIYRYI
jgi:hypothetical protein